MGHLTLSERVAIENALRARKGFNEIARLVQAAEVRLTPELVKP